MVKQDQSNEGELPNLDLNAPDSEVLARANLAEAGAERLKDELLEHHSTGPRLTGGDLDADWQSAKDIGAEAVGGHAPTPGQDAVDAIGRALGIEQEVDDEVHTHDEILRDRDGDRWELDRRSADGEPGTPD